ncbi:MAG: hypothetical protein J5898_12495 [Lachnospiraceae bacterium]|nr:hypothetical protein [Lachnospiraceae bacterium]
MSYPIDVYEGIPQSEIEAVRQTSEGKEYTLNHPQELVVNMRYKGEESSSANSQGWERNSNYYFKELLNNHQEYFSKKNKIRIQNGESPRVDAQFIRAFPQYEGFENETLIHHHVGKDGQAVAVPQSIHKGFGEIHNHEKNLGIIKNAEKFSDLCKLICENNPGMMNQTSDQFKASIKDMDLSDSNAETDNAHVDSDADKQENLEVKEKEEIDVQRQEDSQQQKKVDDYLLQKQLREERQLEYSKYQYAIEDPKPKGILGRIKRWRNDFERKHPFWGGVLRASDQAIVGGAVNYLSNKAENYINNKSQRSNSANNVRRNRSPERNNRNAYIPQSEEGKAKRSGSETQDKLISRKEQSDIPRTNQPGKEQRFVDPEVDAMSSADKEKRNSPREHNVSANRQRYHTKNGVVYRDKKPYISPRPDKKES